MSDGNKFLTGLLLVIMAAFFITGIWTNDERWGGTGLVVLVLACCSPVAAWAKSW